MISENEIIENTKSVCSTCLKIIDAEIIRKDNSVYVSKECDVHGKHTELLEEDYFYHIRKRLFDKDGTLTPVQTKIQNGCPYDCGLCPSHKQHSCIALREVTNSCDLNCPVCYANSEKSDFLSISKISEMMDFFQDVENNKAEILQISGGEPTTHKDIIDIIKLAKNKNFKYVMLNTNGIRIANDLNFVEELSKIGNGFEIYLQFDSFNKETDIKLRGRSIHETKEKAVENLSKFGIPITLVTTVQRGANDKEIGDIIFYGLKTKYVRGINFQPVAYFGRLNNIDTSQRITLSGILKEIEKTTNKLITMDDFIPLPCNVERVATTYLYRDKGGFIPVTRNIELDRYKHLFNNTFYFDLEETLKLSTSSLFACNCFDFLKEIKKIVPLKLAFKSKKEKTKYVDENTFRISVTSFVDRYNFDQRSMQKECVHIITADNKRIPFSAYNMIYREGLNNGKN